jgi:hypothetical protein
MGIFKQMKDMKEMVKAAPGLVEQSQQMAANAQAMQAQMMAQQQAAMAQQQAAMAQQQAAGGATPTGPAFEPIAGVGLELSAKIVKAIVPLNYDQSALPGIAASHGIDSASWQQAHDGWNARIQGDMSVAKAFSDIYAAV